MIQNRNQQVQLCNNLNMNFDEASELFGNETLGDMQIAKVCGGSIPPWVVSGVLKLINPAFAIGSTLYAVYNSFSGTPEEQAWHARFQSSGLKFKKTGDNIEFSIGSIILDFHTEPSGSNQVPCGAQDTIYIKIPDSPCGSTTLPTY